MSESIRVLNNKEQARMKIHVWHGSSSNWINMTKELVGNSLDIFKKQFSEDIINSINIKIHNNNKIEYIDSGTGIPIEGKASDGSNNYEAIFERPFAGSNYENEYTTVGTNGVFLYTLAMTCEDIEFFIGRPDGNIYNIAYHKGDRIKELSVIGKTEKTFSKIIFSLDTEVWDNPNFTFQEIKSIVKGQASLSNTKISVQDVCNDILEEYYYEDGIHDYFNELTSNKAMIIDSILLSKELQQKISKNDTIDNIDFNMIFNFSNDSEENTQKDFLNTADLIQHGTIKDGIILGFRNSIHKYLKDNNKYDKKDKDIVLEDVETSINFICDLNSYNAEYVSQVKQQTLSPHYKTAMKNAIEDFCEVYFLENKIQADLICNQVLINSKARVNADKTRQNLKKKLSEKINIFNKIEGLYEAEESDINKRILCVCEGKSALSSLLSGKRNVHAIFPLKGKILNCLKATPNDIFKNEVILKLFRALNCGMEFKNKLNNEFNSFNIDNLRYHDIYIMVDADVDGIGSIFPLLLTTFYKLAPTLIKEGRIHICETPKYEVNFDDKEEYFAINDEELITIKNDLDYIKNKNKITINYIKGLSELSSHAMELCLEEGYKNIRTITIEDFEKAKDTIELFMDSVVEPRKEYILTNYNNIGLIED